MFILMLYKFVLFIVYLWKIVFVRYLFFYFSRFFKEMKYLIFGFSSLWCRDKARLWVATYLYFKLSKGIIFIILYFFKEIKYVTFPFSSLWCRGKAARERRRWVQPLNSQCLHKACFVRIKCINTFLLYIVSNKYRL